MNNVGLGSLGEIKRVMQRQEKRSRTSHHSDTMGINKLSDNSPHFQPDEDFTPSSVMSAAKARKPLEINTNLRDSYKPKSVCGSSCKKNFDLIDLLSGQDNEYTKALRRIESLKRSTLHDSRHTSSVISYTDEKGKKMSGESEPPVFLLAPQSVLAKESFQNRESNEDFFAGAKPPCLEDPLEPFVRDIKIPEVFLSNKESTEKGLEEAKAQAVKFVFTGPDCEKKEEAEITEYKKKLAAMSKEMRDLKRQFAKQERTSELEELKSRSEQELREVKEDLERKLFSKESEYEDIITKLRGEVGSAKKRLETVQMMSVSNSRPEETDSEGIKAGYEAKIAEIERKHREKKAASEVI